MKRLTGVIVGILGVMLSGCGHTVVETLNVPETPGFNAAGSGKTIVVLPFADYSQGNSIASAHRRNLMITESITDRLVANGFAMPVQEDVFDYLVAQRVINMVPYEKKISPSLTNELSGDWSELMKSEIRRYIDVENAENLSGPAGSPGTHGLTTATVAKIGRQFNADYIVRGRILEYKTRDASTWEPWKKGIIPFIFNGSNRILFGFAESDAYDEENASITGTIIGARVGYESAHWPWGSQNSTILGISGTDDGNAIFWGGVGNEIGRRAHKSGAIDQAAVQMRLWVQEASTGNVIWTNRISVKVSPESFMADNQYDVLFNKAIEKGVATLIDNFITTSM